jgi:Rad3-related DNA helicase
MNVVNDIEEFVSNCKEEVVCPYYLSRETQKNAEMILMPYNYLIDPLIRKSLSLNLEHCIVIIDEAHNIVIKDLN